METKKTNKVFWLVLFGILVVGFSRYCFAVEKNFSTEEIFKQAEIKRSRIKSVQMIYEIGEGTGKAGEIHMVWRKPNFTKLVFIIGGHKTINIFDGKVQWKGYEENFGGEITKIDLSGGLSEEEKSRIRKMLHPDIRYFCCSDDVFPDIFSDMFPGMFSHSNWKFQEVETGHFGRVYPLTAERTEDKAKLWLGCEDGLIHRLEFSVKGSPNTIILKKLIINQPIPQECFTYQPPPEARIKELTAEEFIKQLVPWKQQRVRVERIKEAIESKLKQGVVTVTYGIIISNGPKFLALTKKGHGIGFVADNEGHILTILHRGMGTKNEKVKTVTGEEFKAKIIKRDKETGATLLKIKRKEPLPKLPFGDIKELSVGEDVFVVCGSYKHVFCIHKGFISELDLRGENDLIKVRIPSSKSCLGPLVNIHGEVVGIITSINGTTGQDAVSCTAIPISTIMKRLGNKEANVKIQKLIQDLLEGDVTEYKKAQVALRRIGKSAVPDLIQALKDKDKDRRWMIISMLAKIGDKSAVSAIAEALKDENPTVRWSAAFELRRFGHIHAPSALIDALKDENKTVRENTAITLAIICDKGTTNVLIEALKDEESSVREGAAWALGRIRNKSAILALRSSLKDENPSVRMKAAAALVSLGDESALPVIFKALKYEDQPIREKTIWALEELINGQAVSPSQIVPHLVEALEDKDSSIRRGAAFLLKRIGDKSAIPALERALKCEKESLARAEIVETLRFLGKPKWLRKYIFW